MNSTVKKIILWIAGVLLAAGVIGTTTYKLITGEETTKDALNKVSVSAQVYAADTVSQIVKETVANGGTAAKQTETKEQSTKTAPDLPAAPAAPTTK